MKKQNWMSSSHILFIIYERKSAMGQSYGVESWLKPNTISWFLQVFWWWNITNLLTPFYNRLSTHPPRVCVTVCANQSWSIHSIFLNYPKNKLMLSNVTRFPPPFNTVRCWKEAPKSLSSTLGQVLSARSFPENEKVTTCVIRHRCGIPIDIVDLLLVMLLVWLTLTEFASVAI